MEAWAPLVPENWLLTEQQLVPGLRWRPPAEAAPALGPLGAAAQLPRLCGTSAVRLSGLRMHLPEGFAEVARQVAEGLCHSGAAAAAEANGSTSSGARGTRLPPLLELQQLLRLRVSAHNGRRFVGPPVVCPAAALQPVEGRRGGRRRSVQGWGRACYHGMHVPCGRGPPAQICCTAICSHAVLQASMSWRWATTRC